MPEDKADESNKSDEIEEIDKLVDLEEPEPQEPIAESREETIPVKVNNSQTVQPEAETPVDPEPQASVIESAAETPVPAVVAPTVVVQPAAVVAPVQTSDTSSHNSPGILLLQWLAYAFWGWFALSILWLTTYVMAYFVAGSGTYLWGAEIAYPLAAVGVLLVMAFAVDLFYARKEPARKVGGASAIMLIHTVIFALFGIGALITAVFALINMSINDGVSSSGEGSKVALFTALVMVAVYMLLVARTVFANRRKEILRTIWATLVLVALIVGAFGVFGPAVRANETKTDRLIEDALPTIATNVSDYARENNKLPASLADVSQSRYGYRDDKVKSAISQNLVSYTPNTQKVSRSSVGKTAITADDDQIFYYRLCVTYKFEKKGAYSGQTDSYTSRYGATTVSTASHNKGEQCYDLQTSMSYY